MISPEEKIYSPETNTPQNTKVNVPNKFAYEEPKNLGSKEFSFKKYAYTYAFVCFLAAIGGIVVVVTQNNETKSKFY